MSSLPKDGLGWFRLGVWALVAVFAVVGAFLYFAGPGGVGDGARTGMQRAKIGGAFELVDHTGQAFSSERLKGKPYVLFFGFTHCPDICPTTLQELSVHLKELGDKADAIIPIFITVDPARDTPEKLRAYFESFDPRIIGLSGSEKQIAKVAKLYHAFYEKIDDGNGGYSMNHTASMFLFDREGRLVSTLNWEEKPSIRKGKLEKLISR